ncbi:YhcN/YlaJ family sporulation lipoprotein [Peribacillus sp. NPDC097675]|uniref:YhcN/YlaJ family sporulation lipoprotein n=1 Tax=Peribacillus sp. NPDC097675 TaxID=3390618 RepID=UPI003D02DC07
MKKYKAVISSAMIALFITGCSANENEGANENLGLNRTNQDRDLSQSGYNPTRNVNDRSDTNQINNPNQDTNNQFMVHEDIANRIEDLKEVKRASVIVTDHHAYVGAVLKKGKLTTDVKDKIASAVRNTDASIEDVRVSTNPEFVDRMDHYVKDVKNGKPIKGFTSEFQDLVNRVFPSSH